MVSPGTTTALSLDASLGLVQLLSDATRVRLLALLESRELSVAELTAITELSQSRVSTHLGKLRDAGLVIDRRSGRTSLYRLHQAMPAPARALWTTLRAQTRDGVFDGDATRAEEVLAARAEGTWPDSIAGAMERHYSPGRTWEALVHGLAGLLRLGEVLDIGCGDGFSGTLLAPRAARYVGLDRSATVLEAAESRLAPLRDAGQRIELVEAEMESLPFEHDSFDEVLLFHALTYSSEPARALREAARVLRPGGRMVLTTLRAHEHPDATAAYGHQQAGFAESFLREALREAGLTVEACAATSRERRPPHFEVLTVVATRSPSASTRPSPSDTHKVPHADRSATRGTR